MTLAITCVVDNNTQPGSDLQTEHGLAFWIAAESGAVLLDTGQSGTALLYNLTALGLDATTLKVVALSHAHYDHTGGLPALATVLPPGLPLYANADLLRERFSRREGVRRAIGLSVDADWLQAYFTLHLDDAPSRFYPMYRPLARSPSAPTPAATHRITKSAPESAMHPIPTATISRWCSKAKKGWQWCVAAATPGCSTH